MSAENNCRTPPGFAAIGVFLFFAASMAGLAALTLLRPGTPLDHAWTLNPAAYAQLAPRGRMFGPMFLLLSLALTCAGIGWFRHRLWGWRLAVAIIAIQVLGDVINCIRGDFVRGTAGVVIAGALLFYLLRPVVRTAFVN